jgi:hypothetical protein
VGTTHCRNWWGISCPLDEADIAVVIDGSPEIEVTSEIGDSDDWELEPLRGVNRHYPDALHIAGDVSLPFSGVDLCLAVDPVEQPSSCVNTVLAPSTDLVAELLDVRDGLVTAFVSTHARQIPRVVDHSGQQTVPREDAIFRRRRAATKGPPCREEVESIRELWIVRLGECIPH